MTLVRTDRLVTTQEACRQLDVSRMTLWRWGQAGRLRPVRLGTRTTRWRQTEIDELVEASTDHEPAVIAGALALLAERQAEERRPLCPSCGRRRVNPQASLCTWCVEQQELQLHHKRKWWEANGTAYRNAREADHAST